MVVELDLLALERECRSTQYLAPEAVPPPELRAVESVLLEQSKRDFALVEVPVLARQEEVAVELTQHVAADRVRHVELARNLFELAELEIDRPVLVELLVSTVAAVGVNTGRPRRPRTTTGTLVLAGSQARSGRAASPPGAWPVAGVPQHPSLAPCLFRGSVPHQ